jgi:hypothetical protein
MWGVSGPVIPGVFLVLRTDQYSWALDVIGTMAKTVVRGVGSNAATVVPWTATSW